ncbi:FAD-dependent oxidoreductase [Oculatella sp. LEGE 06141]|uniref:NAD(P)/FAD-dependent oxidoreductase n=1 Tax=Oculatella sp. LEGE 06141 TaxID=1828648 RepID=UPI001881F039|nr:FAD-dependent oxidoreductase [Oculatella sp. LEGE 06141]MBE9181950.1 FAD-dependent oxidoreductase [Oculatella sp. LEGE 06141]
MKDVVVIGAGIAGLVCAQQLQQAGIMVTLVEKSKGLGGRLATRRLMGTCADHGVRYLAAQGDRTQRLVQVLCRAGILQPWAKQYHHDTNGSLIPAPDALPHYSAVQGITAVAKALATHLEILRGHRAIAIAPTARRTWNVTVDSSASAEPVRVEAKALVLAIPAPQALDLLEPVAHPGLSTLLAKLRSVEFDPCISAIAHYAAAQKAAFAEIPWNAVSFSGNPTLSWISIDSRKRLSSSEAPLLVVQSSADFAKRHLNTPDLQPIGSQLMQCAAQLLLPWLNSPDLLQVHRWRYAFASRSRPECCLSIAEPLPLVCSGDWCGGNQVEDALESGLAAADEISLRLGNTLPTPSFDQMLQHLL